MAVEEIPVRLVVKDLEPARGLDWRSGERGVRCRSLLVKNLEIRAQLNEELGRNSRRS
jgi:hypothetical protein